MNKVFERLRLVLEDEKLNYLDKVIFAGLLTFNGRDKIFPSLEILGERVNCKRIPSASKAVNKLKRRGHILIKRRRNNSNLYSIISPILEKQKNQSMMYVLTTMFAKIRGVKKAESSDYTFVSTVLKHKEEDPYEFHKKCLMLMYIFKTFKERSQDTKFKGMVINGFRELNFEELEKKIFDKRKFYIKIKPIINRGEKGVLDD